MVVRELGSRHNVGSAAVRRLARRAHSGAFKTHRASALVNEVRLGMSSDGSPGIRVVLAVPTVFMNESGGPVSALLKYYSTDLDHLVVVYDELDIPFGVVRVKRGGGEGGHNGVRSLTRSLASKDFLRVRVGIGRPPGRMDPADFVLRNFSAAENEQLPLTLDAAADAVESLISSGLLATQQKFHSPPPT
jgi:PTH1 family peptidyl-tRNA hydrolase